ncbi:MAG: biotin transporter BioY [Candidatus Hecatellales archaeon]|nr:MAG: biotin transporter BioY [Candidatus Hecatellales archaeon]
MLKAYETSLASVFAALTALGAYVYIPLPLTPIPVTLQTFFIYLSALILGGRLAALSQALYVLLGCLGLPVFAGGKAGIGVLFGPTGGYLAAFIPAAYVAGRVCKAGRPLRTLTGLTTATIIIYAGGTLQLWILMNTIYGEGLGFMEALTLGVLPFIPGDTLKIFLAFLASKSRSIESLRVRLSNLQG